MLLKCGECSHTWATDLPSLPEDIQEAVHALDLSDIDPIPQR
jgi:hypothetical protein